MHTGSVPAPGTPAGPGNKGHTACHTHPTGLLLLAQRVQETWSPQSCNGSQAQRLPRLQQEQIPMHHCGQSPSYTPTMEAPIIPGEENLRALSLLILL